jgi:hypothetical protein
MAIAWLLGQKPWIVPIPGTTKLHRLEENVGAANVELAGDDLAEIERAASEITVLSERGQFWLIQANFLKAALMTHLHLVIGRCRQPTSPKLLSGGTKRRA